MISVITWPMFQIWMRYRLTALCHPARNKAGCSSGILPEMVKMICRSVLLSCLPVSEIAGVFLRIGKMCYLFHCQGRKICHFVTIGMASQVVDKVFAKIIQRRMQVVCCS